MSYIELSEEVLTYINAVKKRVRREKGFAPSYADVIHEMVYQLKAKKVVLFRQITIKKVRARKVRSGGLGMPVSYVRSLKYLGFEQHDSMMYLKKDDVLLMVMKTKPSTYIIKNSRDGIIYEGRMTRVRLLGKIRSAMKKM